MVYNERSCFMWFIILVSSSVLDFSDPDSGILIQGTGKQVVGHCSDFVPLTLVPSVIHYRVEEAKEEEISPR